MTQFKAGLRATDRSKSRRESWLYAVVLSCVYAALAFTFLPELHVTLILALAAGCALIGVDAVHWLRGGFDTFDPRGIVGAFGLHFYVAAPSLHVAWDFWAMFVSPAEGWLPAVELIAYLNLVGLMIYRLTFVFARRRPAPYSRRTSIDSRTLRTLAWTGFVVSLGFFAVFVISQGGPVAYFLAISDDKNTLDGSGWLLILGEAFPLLALAATIVGSREKLRNNVALLVVVILLFIATQFFVGGLRGSRSNTVWPVIIGLTMVHLLVRRISPQKIIAVGLVGVVFMYGYSFYKSAGRDALDLFSGETTTAQLSQETGRSFEGLMLGDFGRSDVQALVVSRSTNGSLDYALGRSYIGDLSLLTPPSIREALPQSKTYWGTNAWHGSGTAEAGIRSTRIFGAAGEATLNFGIPGYLLSFAVVGLVVRRTSRWYESCAKGDDLGQKLVAGSACIICLLVLSSDLDNVAWFALKQLLPLFTVVSLARYLADQRSPAGQDLRISSPNRSER